MRPPHGTDERGMILVNVLLFVAIASAVVLLMITAEEGGLHRSLRFAEASRARAAALAGEASAIVALRRDGLVAPETDHAGEPWAGIATHHAPIRGGHFDLAIADAQDRFNINLLMKDDPASIALARGIADSLGLPPDLLFQVVDYIRIAGPVADLGPLAAAQLKPDVRARLADMVTALPYDSRVDLNSVREELLGIMIGDPVAAHALVALRARRGFLTPEDLLVQHVSPPALSSYGSTMFWVRIRATIGDTDQQLTSLLLRSGGGQRVVVRPVARWWGRAPDQAPALPE